MKPSTFTILLIWATLSIAGLAFLPLLRVQWQPSRALPSLTVSYSWQNVSGRVIEQEVTSVLEGGLNRIRGINKISSTSYNNGGYIIIDFDKKVEMDAARFEAASIIRQLYPSLPQGVTFPVLSLNRPNNEKERPILTYSLQASANPAGIQQYAEEQLKPQLAQIDGVSRIIVYGAAPYEWMIEYDADKLQAVGLSPASIQQAVSRYFDMTSLGMVQDYDENGRLAWMQLSVGSLPANPSHLPPNPHTKEGHLPPEPPPKEGGGEQKGWGSLPLQIVGGRVIRLEDIATIRHIEQEPTSYYRINGMNRINLVIYASPQSNHIVLAQQIKAKISEILPELPKGYYITNTYDSTEYISQELNKIYLRAIATVCILLLFILIVTRKIRFLAIILISILANICIALGMYYLLHIEIHLYTLAGITISLGLIIDNTIVMVEHIRIRGNKRVFIAILAATITTVISLSAIFFLDEKIKLDLVDFAIVIIINLLVSLTSAWFLTPALYKSLSPSPSPKERGVSKISLPTGEGKGWGFYTSVISLLHRKQWIVWIIFILGFGLPLFMLPDKIDEKSRFADIYKKTLGSQWYLEKAKPIADKVFGGSLRLFVRFVYEGSQWKSDRERTTLYVNAYMPAGSTIVQMNQSIEILEQFLSGYKEIDRFETSINNAQNARITITFKKEYEFGYFPHQLKSELITKSINSGAAEWSVYGIGDGFSNRMYESTGSYRIKLFGYNYDQLYGYAGDIRNVLLENQRIKEVNIMSRYTWEKNKNREFTLTPDIQLLAMNNISLPLYFNIVRNAAGNEQYATSALIDGTYQNIKYRSKQLSDTDRWKLYNNLLKMDDTFLKLKTTSEMVKEVEQMEVCKEDQQYTMVVSYDYIGSARMGAKLHERTIKETNEILPLGYRAETEEGYWYWWKKEKKQYWLIVLILIVMYMVCAILFESLWQPLAVISLVPFGFIGLFLTFYLFHLNFDEGGFASMVLLCGLTINAAIYIINDYNNLKKSPCSSRQKYIQAFQGKITPVMLTIFSTIFGLIPFIVGEHREPFWFALAAGTMGGLLFSLVGIMFYLPMFFFREKKKI